MPYCDDILVSTHTKTSAIINRPSGLNFLTHAHEWLRWNLTVEFSDIPKFLKTGNFKIPITQKAKTELRKTLPASIF